LGARFAAALRAGFAVFGFAGFAFAGFGFALGLALDFEGFAPAGRLAFFALAAGFALALRLEADFVFGWFFLRGAMAIFSKETGTTPQKLMKA